jgi:hypothetical protein
MLGVFSIFAAAVFTSMGKVWVRFTDWIYRAKEPGWFWWEVALYFSVEFGSLDTSCTRSTGFHETLSLGRCWHHFAHGTSDGDNS